MKKIFALIVCIFVFFLTSCVKNNVETTQESTHIEESQIYEKDYGNFSTVNKRTPPFDREKQIKSSQSDYNTGSSYPAERLAEILSSAGKIKNLGTLVYPNAAKFMAHYLEGSGEDYTIDMEKFLENAIAKQNMNADIERAKKAAQELVIKGKTADVYQKTESLHHNLTGDFKYCLGSYFAYVEMHNVSFDGTTYTATVKYTVIDFYNWDKTDTTPVFDGFVSKIVGSISPADLHQLHTSGVAKEFLSIGELSYEISWTK